jgi:lysophospholipase L1-like esterase
MLARSVWCLAVVSALVACADTAAMDTTARRPTLVGAGPMPAISNPPAVSDPSIPPPTNSPGTLDAPGTDAEGSVTRSASVHSVPGTTPAVLVGEVARGNRLLALGDSILASVSSRYTDDLCKALVPLGWDVEVEAESGRFVTFGADVVKKLTAPPRPAGPWDVVVIGFGSNYRGDPLEFRTRLEALIDSVAPAHVVLVTVTPFEANRDEVNTIIEAIARARPTVVSVMDWAAVSTFNDDYIGGDGLHLTDPGRVAYAAQAAQLLGPAPQPVAVDGSTPATPKTVRATYDSGPAAFGACRASAYTDDSAGPVRGTGTRPPSSTKVTQATRPPVVQTTKRRRTSTSRPRKTTTTAAPSTTAEPTTSSSPGS